jgi:hypothetical protein
VLEGAHSQRLQLALAELRDPESFRRPEQFHVRRRPQIDLANRLPFKVEMLALWPWQRKLDTSHWLPTK